MTVAAHGVVLQGKGARTPADDDIKDSNLHQVIDQRILARIQNFGYYAVTFFLNSVFVRNRIMKKRTY